MHLTAPVTLVAIDRNRWSRSVGTSGHDHRNAQGFEDGLKDTGYIAGKNVAIEYRFADGQFERFPGFISEFVKRKVAVLVTSSAGVPSAKKATSTIPIIFTMGDDPVKTGIVPSLNRPGGNVTGVYQFTTGLEGKRLGLLHDMIPKASTLAVLIHPNNDVLAGSNVCFMPSGPNKRS